MNRLLLAGAVVLFVLAALVSLGHGSFGAGPLALDSFGLACFAGSGLV